MFSQSCVSYSLFAVFLAIFAFFLQLYERKITKTELLLGVCVLSAREHRDQRAAIRSTWLATVTHTVRDGDERTNRIVVKFVVGRDGCPVHPADRVDQYGCQEWIPSILPDMSKDFEAFITDESCRMVPNISRLSVRVMHPIILKRIGILADVPLSDEPVVVSIFRDFDEEELVSAQFSLADQGIMHTGYRYQPVEPVELHSGTQLEMSVNSKADEVRASTMKMISGTSGIALQRGVRQLQGPGVLLVEGMHEDGTVIKDGSLVLSVLSFMYTVHDVERLRQHCEQRLQRQTMWQTKLQAEAEALEAEAEEGDILLVDGIDVYRSLPSKLLQCHDWFSQKHVASHVMKTDDDSYVDVRAVVDILSGHPLRGHQWWGNFRREWAVERVGKWREEDYPPSVYPPFACGSGYVVSRDLHLWLAANHPSLHAFQGEDISVGIWLAPLAPVLLQDERWQCFSLCTDNMLSMPDLSPDQMRARWNQHLHCATPCSTC